MQRTALNYFHCRSFANIIIITIINKCWYLFYRSCDKIGPLWRLVRLVQKPSIFSNNAYYQLFFIYKGQYPKIWVFFFRESGCVFFQAEITLSTVPEADDSLPSPLAASPLPPVSTASVKSEEFRSSETEAESGGFEPRLQNQSSNSFQNFHTTTSLNTSTSSGSLIKPFDSENPWDLVPDQPALIKEVAVNLDGPSATTSTLPLPVAAVSNGGNFKTPSPHLVIGSNDSKNDSDSSTSPASSTITTKNIDKKENNQSLPINVMDDPFDADWVSLALKQTNNQQILWFMKLYYNKNKVRNLQNWNWNVFLITKN